MEKVIQYVGELGAAELTTMLIIAVLFISNLPNFLKSCDYIIDRFFGGTKGTKRRKEQDQKCAIQAAAIKALEEKLAEYDKNNRDHWNVSKDYQASYKQTQLDIIKSLNDLNDQLKDMRKTTDERFAASETRDLKRVRAEMKDKIGERYRRYHSKGEINDMEYEALCDLIDEYEAAGGENSFVHSVVQPEMYTWTRI